jgi:aspartate/methionine/tyrosine aminotransferase
MKQPPPLSNLVEHTLAGLSPIQTIMKMADERNIKQLGLDPSNVISFGGGWCNHHAPPLLQTIYQEISSDTKQFHRSGRYSAILGNYNCRQQITNYEKHIFKIKNLSVENICLGQSSTQLFHDIIRTLSNPRQKISVLDPTYANYFNAIKCALPGSTIKYIPALNTRNWTYLQTPDQSLEKLKQQCTNGTKMLVLPVPDNPTSQIPSNEFIKGCYEILEDNNSFLVLDFAYKTLYFNQPPQCFSWSPNEMPNLVSLHTNSKWLSSLGRRFGWIEAHPTIIKGIEKINESTLLSADTLHSLATSQFLKITLQQNMLIDYITETRKLYQKTAKILINSINKHLGWSYLVPQGGLYTCCPTPNNQFSIDFSEDLLKNTGILVIPGYGFGPSMNNAVRLSYGPLCYNHVAIQEGIERIARYIN